MRLAFQTPVPYPIMARGAQVSCVEPTSQPPAQLHERTVRAHECVAGMDALRARSASAAAPTGAIRSTCAFWRAKAHLDRPYSP